MIKEVVPHAKSGLDEQINQKKIRTERNTNLAGKMCYEQAHEPFGCDQYKRHSKLL